MRPRHGRAVTVRLLRRMAVLPLLITACDDAVPVEGWRGTRRQAGDTAVVATEAGYAVAAEPLAVPVRQIWKSDALQRAVAIAVLGDSLLAIADLDRIHLLSATGESRGTVGRPGDGPGEFRSIEGLAPVEDGLLVWDGSAARLTWLRPDGRVARTAPVVPPEGYATPVRVDLVPSAGGVALAWSPGMVVPGAPASTRIVFHPLEGGASQELAAVGSVALVPLPRLRIMVPQEVYGPLPLFAVSPGGTLAVSDGTVFRIDLRPLGAGRVLRLEQGGQGAPLSRCEREPCLAALRREAELTAQDEALLQERMRVQRPPRRRSRLDALVFDDREVLWVRLVDGSRRYDPMLLGQFPELRPPTYTWELFAPDGRRLAAVQLDSRFTPRAFVGGRVFGTYRLDTGEDAVAVGDLPAVLRSLSPRAGAAEQGRGG